MNPNKVISLCLMSALFTAALTGCTTGTNNKDASAKLDPNSPVSLKIWHYYNGLQQTAFDELVADFNATKGKELGIYVEGTSRGSVADLEESLSDAASGKVGADPLPDIFSTYSDTAYTLQQDGLIADLSKYFTEEELSAYVDSYISEGYFNSDNSLYLFPVAKSTEVMMLNVTDWTPFAEATGATYDDLLTLEGVASTAQRYYEWTDAQTPDIPNDGKAFYGRDSMSNYFVIGMMQMGTEIFTVKDGIAEIHADKEKIRRLWDNYYIPMVRGYFAALGKFRSDDVKTGDLLAYTGSSSSASYFPDAVMTDDETRAIDYIVLPIPIMEGGERINVQQGAGMAVTKSDEAHQYAASIFLKWFTQKENNLRFACGSSYLPVTKEANTIEALDEEIASRNISISSKTYDCLSSILKDFSGTSFYSTKCFKNGYFTRKILDYTLSDKAIADRKAIVEAVAQGADADTVIAEYISEEAFDLWYDEFCAALNEKANA